MAERKIPDRTISHGMPDELDATLEERARARREGDRTEREPAPKQSARYERHGGNTDLPVAPGEEPGGPGTKPSND